jgi:hypothetical protein
MKYIFIICGRSTWAVCDSPSKSVRYSGEPEKKCCIALYLTNEPPTPLITLQLPVPTTGLLAANVTLVKLQVAIPVWSGPAFAVVVILKEITTSSKKRDMDH